MTVRLILEAKGRDVVTLEPTATMSDAVRTLATKRIGALIVVHPDGGVAGILSERDVVRMIGTDGPDCLSRAIGEVMTAKVITCSEETTVEEAMEMMTRGRFRHIPVCVDGHLVGIISIGDVVKRRIEDAEREASHMREYITG
ncbi:CBS domain-containing protein [Mangrovicella endophytica]|uniref:CBS domain-containing protein n=1 Tax=Mangrovicella endophytica TaxID=2066697 RepID=UPI000C9DF2DA|nr:CBS domain-containing protein [Mangrovicella endophytica]